MWPKKTVCFLWRLCCGSCLCQATISKVRNRAFISKRHKDCHDFLAYSTCTFPLEYLRQQVLICLYRENSSAGWSLSVWETETCIWINERRTKPIKQSLCWWWKCSLAMTDAGIIMKWRLGHCWLWSLSQLPLLHNQGISLLLSHAHS